MHRQPSLIPPSISALAELRRPGLCGCCYTVQPDSACVHRSIPCCLSRRSRLSQHRQDSPQQLFSTRSALRCCTPVVSLQTYCQARAWSHGLGLLLQLTDAKYAVEYALQTGLREVQHGARQLQHTAQHGSKAVQRRLRRGSEQVGMMIKP